MESLFLKFKNIVQNKTFKSSVFLILLFLTIFYFFKAPTSFPKGQTIHIENGAILSDISNELKEKEMIRSKILFQILLITLSGEKSVVAGDYYFENSGSVLNIAKRLSKGDFKINKIKVTIPEGFNVREIADLFSQKFENFNIEEFKKITESKEGYLFPDTYYFFGNENSLEIFNLLSQNFDQKIKTIEIDLKTTDRSLEDIMIMASIIEKETNNLDDRNIVSGILWKRISKKMPLQVDASFYYLLNKQSSDITLNDLKIDSPYNTYKYRGLPPTPISNPGIKSILASIYPKDSPYFFYLHDKDGKIHYARDFEEHKRNKALYLR